MHSAITYHESHRAIQKLGPPYDTADNTEHGTDSQTAEQDKEDDVTQGPIRMDSWDP